MSYISQPITLASAIETRRREIGVPRDEIATRAGISKNYYGAIASGKVTPPNSTLCKILDTLAFSEGERRLALELAALERGLAREDAGLPDEMSRLIADLRKSAFDLPTEFVAEMRRQVREVR